MIDLGELLEKIRPFVLGWIGEWHDYVPTLTGFSANPTGCVYRYSLVGKVCTLVIRQGTNGTSNATTFTITLPFAAATVTDFFWEAPIRFTNGGSAGTVAGLAVISSAGTTVLLFTSYALNAWANTGGKRVSQCTIVYEIA